MSNSMTTARKIVDRMFDRGGFACSPGIFDQLTTEIASEIQAATAAEREACIEVLSALRNVTATAQIELRSDPHAFESYRVTTDAIDDAIEAICARGGEVLDTHGGEDA